MVRFITTAPKVTHESTAGKPLSVRVGGTLCLEVNVIGVPKPVVTWYHEQQKLNKGSKVAMESAGSWCYLKVRDVKEDDRGIYKVKAENMAGVDHAEFSVSVKSSLGLRRWRNFDGVLNMIFTDFIFILNNLNYKKLKVKTPSDQTPSTLQLLPVLLETSEWRKCTKISWCLRGFLLLRTLSNPSLDTKSKSLNAENFWWYWDVEADCLFTFLT